MQTAAKQNYRGSVAFYYTWPVNEFGLFYNGSSRHRTVVYYEMIMSNSTQVIIHKQQTATSTLKLTMLLSKYVI